MVPFKPEKGSSKLHGNGTTNKEMNVKITFRCIDASIWSTRLISLKSIVSFIAFESDAAVSFSESTASIKNNLNENIDNRSKESSKPPSFI